MLHNNRKGWQTMCGSSCEWIFRICTRAWGQWIHRPKWTFVRTLDSFLRHMQSWNINKYELEQGEVNGTCSILRVYSDVTPPPSLSQPRNHQIRLGSCDLRCYPRQALILDAIMSRCYIMLDAHRATLLRNVYGRRYLSELPVSAAFRWLSAKRGIVLIVQ